MVIHFPFELFCKNCKTHFQILSVMQIAYGIRAAKNKFLKLLENRNIRKWNPAGIQPAKIALRREHSADTPA
jgi:hypothetical protein